MSCGERISELMRSKHLTQQEVADQVGVARQSISLWQKDQTTPSGRNLEKLANVLGTTSSYLLFGEKSSNVKVFDDDDTPPDDVVVIHEYQLVFGAASEGREAASEWEIVEGGDDYWYKRSFFQKRHLNPDKCKRAKVTGDSMEPYIYGGDTVLFSEVCDPRPTCVTIQDGKVYVISVDGKLKIKRLASTKDGIAVRSDNPSYKTEEFTGDELDRLRIYGRVIEISRSV